MSALEDRLKAVKQRPRQASPAETEPERTSPAPQSARRVGGRRPKPKGERWDDRVRRATFYIDVDLLDDLDATCTALGLNKSEVVREALRQHLIELNAKQ